MKGETRMNKSIEKILKIGAKMSEKIAVKSCSVTSAFDSYQPVIPDAVKKEARKNKVK